MSTSDYILGIDLGTTNSVVAILDADQPRVINNAEGSTRTPSVVSFMPTGEVLVGEVARRQGAVNPTRTVYSIKRLMGRTPADVEALGLAVPYELASSTDHQLLVKIGDEGYTPSQISAFILRKLKDAAQDYLGEEVVRAIITVPAYFDDLQRQATREAGTAAGLEVLRLVNEPTAAAMAYGLAKEQRERVGVYDFGGGTFDLTILDIHEGTFEVLTSQGDTHLGGDDLDDLLVQLLLARFRETIGTGYVPDPMAMRRLIEAAEKAKCELSGSRQAVIHLPFLAQLSGTPLHLETTVTRDEFEDLIEHLIEQTIDCCRTALEDCNLQPQDIEKIILVGGSTRIPIVQDMVEEFFGITPFKGINPDEIVALGAATQGGVLAGKLKEVLLLDVTPHSLGIEVKDNKVTRIIEKNSTIPLKAARVFTTTEDGQEMVTVNVLQGESESAIENRPLGKFTLTGIEPGKAGAARLQVAFQINADGIVEVSAEDMKTHQLKTMSLSLSGEQETGQLARDRAHNRANVRRKRKRVSPRSTSVSPSEVLTGMNPTAKRLEDSAVRRKSDSKIRPRGITPASLSPVSIPESNPGVPTQSPVSQSVPNNSPAEPKLDEVSSPSAPTSPFRSESAAAAARSHEIEPNRPFSKTSSAPASFVPENQQAPQSKRNDTDKPNLAESARPPAHFGSTSSSAGIPPNIFENQPTTGFGEPLTRSVLTPNAVKALQFIRERASTATAYEVYLKAYAELREYALRHLDESEVTEDAVRVLIMLGERDAARNLLRSIAESTGADSAKINKLFEEFVSKFPQDPGKVAVEGFAAQNTERVDTAIRELEQVVTDTAGTDEDIDTLIQLYRRSLTQKDDSATQFKLVQLLVRLNRIDEAINILQRLVQTETYRSHSLKILGLCFWQKGLHYLAWQKFQQLPPNDEIKDILYRLAGDMEDTDQLLNAKVVLQHLVNTDSHFRDSSEKLSRIEQMIRLEAGNREASMTPSIFLTLKDSRFNILEEINRGSMGIVYRAQDKVLEEIVALKILNDYMTSDPSAVERFKREARAAKRLSHPNIVRIHDMFEYGNKKLLSMEYIEGVDLKTVLADRDALPLFEIVGIGRPVCEALAYAHKQSIVHRDIKPANIMITNNNQVKVTDFGIAKVLLAGPDSTRSGSQIIGTPLYMSPEQIMGQNVDARTDIYSLGATLYELSCGRTPFIEGNIEYHHLHSQPPPLPDFVPPSLAEIILKCLEKKPADRFQTTDALSEALARLSLVP